MVWNENVWDVFYPYSDWQGSDSTSDTLPTSEELVEYLRQEVNDMNEQYIYCTQQSAEDVNNVFKGKAYLLRRLASVIAYKEQKKSTPDEDLLCETANVIKTMKQLLKFEEWTDRQSSDTLPLNPETWLDDNRSLLNLLKWKIIHKHGEYEFLGNPQRKPKLNQNNNSLENWSDTFRLLEGINLTQEDIDWYQIFETDFNDIKGLSSQNRTPERCNSMWLLLKRFINKLEDNKIDKKMKYDYKRICQILDNASSDSWNYQYNYPEIRRNWTMIKTAVWDILKHIKDDLVESNL